MTEILSKIQITSNVKQPVSQAKKSIDRLLSKIEPVDLWKICEELGWTPKQNPDGSDKPPALRHLKVSIVHELMRIAKTNDWHLIRDNGTLYIYSGNFWIKLEVEHVKDLLKNAAIKLGFPEIEARDNRFLDQLFQQLSRDGFFDKNDSQKQSLINLKNCTLVLNDQGITPKAFDYKDFLTYQLDFNYDPKARNDLFLKFLDEVLPNRDTQRTLQEVQGYLFIKNLKLEKLFFLYGSGSNGKSVLFEIMTGLLGKENISSYSLESLCDSSGYYRAMIKDKIINFASDIKLNRLDVDKFKTLASGEDIESRLPYQQPFIMCNYAKLIFSLNRLDNAFVEHTHGFFRKILIIPFNQTIPEHQQDKALHKKILANRAGVLNWIIGGAHSVLLNQGIFESGECQQFKQQFIKDTDNVHLFIETHGYKPDEIIACQLKHLYQEYKAFCGQDGYKALGKINFSKRLESLGFKRCRDNSNRDVFMAVQT